MVDKWENKIHFSATVQTFIDMKIMLWRFHEDQC